MRPPTRARHENRFERFSTRRVPLLPDNPDSSPIELRETDAAAVRVVAEFVEVLTT